MTIDKLTKEHYEFLKKCTTEFCATLNEEIESTKRIADYIHQLEKDYKQIFGIDFYKAHADMEYDVKGCYIETRTNPR